MKWTLAFAVTLISAASVAEEMRSPAIDALRAQLAIAGVTVLAPGEPATAAPDYRALWSDPAIRDFIGLSENAWDFTAPDAIPGFGPLPHDHSAR